MLLEAAGQEEAPPHRFPGLLTQAPPQVLVFQQLHQPLGRLLHRGDQETVDAVVNLVADAADVAAR